MTEFDERLRRRVLAQVLPGLGPRWALVTDGTATGVLAAARPAVTVGVADGFGTVRGALDRWPILSDSVTGALIAVTTGDAAADTCREAARVLQPGGVAVFLATWPAQDVPAFDAVLAAAGLTRTRRHAIRRVGAEPDAFARIFPGIESRRTAAATGEEAIECALVARAPGGFETDYPTSRGMLASLFIPRRFSRGPAAEKQQG